MNGLVLGFGWVLGIFGAGLIVVASIGLPWLRFEVAGIQADGLEVPTAQVLAALGTLGVLIGGVGCRSQRPKIWSTALLCTAASSCVWIALATACPTAALIVPEGETLTLTYGIDVAGLSTACMLLGSLLVLATSKPHQARNARRVMRLSRGLAASIELVNPHDDALKTRRLGWLVFDATTAAGIGAVFFAQALFGALIFGAGVQ